jgi:TRAP-type C4-dicarboxylate transport system permease small subunit
VSSVRQGIQIVTRVFSWISGAFILVLMLLVVLEVFLRDVFSTTIGGTIEISEVMLAFLVFLGVAYAQQSSAHVNTNLVTSRIPPRVAGVVRTVGLVIAALVMLWAAWASAGRGWDSFQAGEARFGLRSVPVWPARLIIPVGFALLALETLFTAHDAWRSGRPTGGASGEVTP